MTHPPLAHAAFPGVNGKIAFCSDRDTGIAGIYEIYVMNADGSGVTRLTHNSAFDCNPAWSRDGTKIAFKSERDGNPEIYVMNADGSGQTRLTNTAGFEDNPAWSPDGTKIAFQCGVGAAPPEICAMNADGTGYTQLTFNGTDDDAPSWSPDGTKITYNNQVPGGVREIFVMNPDGTGQTNLTNNGGFNSNPDWSPDGTKIAYHSGAGFCGPNCEVFVMNADGSGQTNLTNNPASDSHPKWSPDGTRIIFLSYRDERLGEIYTMNADGSDVTRLTTNAAGDARPAWQPLPSRPPVANAGTDQMVECANHSGTSVTLDGSASSDPDGDTLTFQWTDAGNNVIGNAATVNVAAPLGTSTYTLKVTDPGGLFSTASTNVTVKDTTPPVLTLSTNNMVVTLPTASATGAAVSLAGIASASDICDPSPTLTNNAPSLFPIGLTTVTFTATDHSGNPSQQQLTVQVVYSFAGYFTPLLNNGQAVFKSGRTIPVKFQLAAADGTIVSNAIANIQVFKVLSTPSGTVDMSVDTFASGSSNSGTLFRFDPTSGQYIYNLSTQGYTLGTYLIRTTLNDGTTHDVQFSLK